MDEDEQANLVWCEVFEHNGYFTYVARGKDVGISFLNSSDEQMVFELDDVNAGLREEETLMGIPTEDRSWEIDPDELAGLIAVFSNMNAKTPIFEDYFLGLRELWKLIDLFNGVCIPVQIIEAVLGEDDFIEAFDRIADPKNEMPLDERVIGLMFMLSYRRGNVDRLFGRYVVIADEPITTDDLDEAVLEKIKSGGKLLEVRTAWFP